ncbi:neutral amino acid transporter 9-like isoform X2 [Tubulanus polymorphus]|uniref:neutral amino acid transporter 9-like isoform X2 n=1 Tax=Tubulanus polymorphus TaxID=672921 RepID=UPI003DA63685
MDPKPKRKPSNGTKNEQSPLLKGSSSDLDITHSESPTSSRSGRRPLHYHSINPTEVYRELYDHDENTVASINRYKYYSKLAPHGRNSLLLMPDHVVPAKFFAVIPLRTDGTQSSIVTIFSIWNTMMGTSLLSIPWAIQQAGFATGITLMCLMAAITLYTAYLVIRSPRALEGKVNVLEFSDVCRYYLGKWGELAGIFFSVATLLGAMIVFWVLMSNFLFNTVSFIHDKATNSSIPSPHVNHTNHGKYLDAVCPHPPHIPSHNATVPPQTMNFYDFLMTTPMPPPKSIFHKVWDQVKTVPFFLIAAVFPLINFKSPTFFTKFNSLGTISVMYIVAFVVVKAAYWGFHLDFNASDPTMKIHQFVPTFFSLTGTLSLAFFVHNCALSILRMQKNPQNNGRDLSIAYILVSVTYIFVGLCFYSAFPYAKACIEDNLLNNLANYDLMAMIARVCLFFQMMTVFPLLTYIFRVQILYPIFGSVYPGVLHVLILNAILVTICVLFARFLPHIGVIIRFSGAFCGLAYIFCLPCIVYMLERKKEGTLTIPVIVFHCGLIVLGIANFIGQFVRIG